MATAKSQDNRLALSNLSEICTGLAITLSGTFQSVRDRVITPYRERLCDFEKSMYDAFHLCQKRFPEHRVFLAISDPADNGAAERFESATVADAKQRVAQIKGRKNGAYAFIGLDLGKSFESQWTTSPDGTGNAIGLAKAHTYNRAPGILLSSPSQDRAAQSELSGIKRQ